MQSPESNTNLYLSLRKSTSLCWPLGVVALVRKRDAWRGRHGFAVQLCFDSVLTLYQLKHLFSSACLHDKTESRALSFLFWNNCKFLCKHMWFKVFFLKSIYGHRQICVLCTPVLMLGKHRDVCIWRNAQKISWKSEILSNLAECLTDSKSLLMTGTSNSEVPGKNVQTHQQQFSGRSCSVCVVCHFLKWTDARRQPYFNMSCL